MLVQDWLNWLREKEDIFCTVPEILIFFEVVFNFVFIFRTGHYIHLNPFALIQSTDMIQPHEPIDENFKHRASRIKPNIIDTKRHINFQLSTMRGSHNKNSS